MADEDENLWLEETHGHAALAWVEQQNDATRAEFASTALDARAAEFLEVMDSDARIPFVQPRGDYYYNLWKDQSHPRGLWRRTTLESYLSDDPDWDVLLDIDRLGAEEETEWVFGGARLRQPDHSRALVNLSPDGGDAVSIREFDLETKSFVDGGFTLPTAKTDVSWIDDDAIYVSTDFGPGSLTSSSYPRSVRILKRGDRLERAELVAEISADEMTVGAHRDHTPGFQRDLIREHIDFFRVRTFLRTSEGRVRIEVPDDADLDIERQWLLIRPRSPWTVDGLTYPSGCLLAIRFDDFLAGARGFVLLFTPDVHSALESWAWTRDHLILTTLRDVATELTEFTPPDESSSEWTSSPVSGVGDHVTARIVATDPLSSNEYWLHVTSFTTPPSLMRGVSGGGRPLVAKASPAFFDADDLITEQHWATSPDGTRVPYFQVGNRELMAKGAQPTLLSGYGGFQVSRLPEYSGITGRGWLARGGVYVIANIRGGGEFGPDWHTAALREKRPRAYEDFAAVARDLVERGVTTTKLLGCEGRSNGGLLVGNMLVTYPELFGAVVCGVPLLDMRRYSHLSAGASWIAEYGDPDRPEDWEFIRSFSPYQLARAGVHYPPALIYAATSDDRVGPAQARKMAARMQRLGADVSYFENTEGGHGGAVDNTEVARLNALIYEFLWMRLTGGVPATHA